MAHVKNNSGNNEWYTPVPFIDAAKGTMGGIDLDPASSEIANRIVGARAFFTKESDGLSQKWHGRVWVNPPYVQPLVRQFCEAVVGKFKSGEIDQAIVLVNNGTETAWGQLLLSMANSVCFPAKRIKFLDCRGKPKNSPIQGQMIVYFGLFAGQFHENFSRFGVVIRREGDI